LVDGITADLARLLARQGLNQLIGLLGGIGGGAAPGASAITLGSGFGGFYAQGGETDPHKPYVVGEQGPELFIPKTSGTVIPNKQIKNLGSDKTIVTAPPPQVHVHITNVSDPKEVTNAIGSSEGAQQIMNVITRNKQAVKRAIA